MSDHFNKWFDQIKFDTSIAAKQVEEEFKEEHQRQSNILALATKITDKADTSDEKDEKKNNNNETNDINKFIWLITDSIGIKKSSSNLITSKYFWTLGGTTDTNELKEDSLSQLKQQIVDSMPSVTMNKKIDHRDSDDSNDNSESESEPRLPHENDNSSDNNVLSMIKFINNNKKCFKECIDHFANGFINNKSYLRIIIDSIKCGVGIKKIKSLLNLDFSENMYEFTVNCSNLLSILCEISDRVIIKHLFMACIEQHIPIPILYPMCTIYYNNNNNNGNNNGNNNDSVTTSANVNIIDNDIYVNIDWYLRDMLHFASQSKLLHDIKSSMKHNRNKPLVMFVGSKNVRGKSTMLSKLYENGIFNMNNDTPLHKNSVDLIFLQENKDTMANYHILDVHGTIDSPFFNDCGINVSRMSALINLASLCHCIIVEIDKSELTSKSIKTNSKQQRK